MALLGAVADAASRRWSDPAGRWYRWSIRCHLSDTFNMSCRIPLRNPAFGNPSRRALLLASTTGGTGDHQGVGFVGVRSWCGISARSGSSLVSMRLDPSWSAPLM